MSISRESGLPECTGGWRECLISSQSFFRGLAPLRLRDGYQLRCFASAMGGDAVSRLYAVPWVASETPRNLSEVPALSRDGMASASGKDNPEYVWHLADGIDELDFRDPVPPGALAHFMLAVEGDDSPYSYLLASLLGRDGEELFAAWHGVRWRAHYLLLKSPFWSFERAYLLACEVVEAFQNSPLRDDMLSTFKHRAKEIAWDHGVSEGLAEICRIRPAFLWDIISDYSFTLELMNIEAERAAGKTGPLTGDYKVPIPPGWLAAQSIPPTPPSKFSWTNGPPEDWRPTVTMADDTVKVQFLTYAHRDDAFVRHTDTFPRGVYLPERKSEVVGKGGGGYMV